MPARSHRRAVGLAIAFAAAGLVAAWTPRAYRDFFDDPPFHPVLKLDPAHEAARVRRDWFNQTRAEARLYKIELTEKTLAGAYDDGPHQAGHALYAERTPVMIYTDWDRHFGEPRNVTVQCLAIRNADGTTRHWILWSDRAHLYRNGMDDFDDWILTGCAWAIRDGAAALDPAQVDAVLSPRGKARLN